MEGISFLYPRLLWLLLGIAPLIGYYVWRTLQGGASVSLSDTSPLQGEGKTLRYYLRHLPAALRMLAVAAVIVALARPQSSHIDSKSTTEGIDIIMTMDISGSMLARDFKPDRIGASKDVAARFIAERPNDRIGLVAFAGESFTQCPLTTDKATLLSLLARLKCFMVADGTAIGDGLATSVNRLRDSEAKSKVVILLTDGVNNAGQVAPLTAAEIAQQFDIKVYTIGVGTMGTAPYPTVDLMGNLSFQPAKVEIDEDILRKIAAQTGGEYFRATDNDKLDQIYKQINALEKTKVETDDKTVKEEKFLGWVLLALALMACEFLLKSLYLKHIP